MNSSIKRFFNDLSVRQKLLTGFGLVLAITLLVAWTSWRALEGALHRFDILLRVNDIDTKLYQVRQHEKDFIIRSDEQAISSALQLIGEIQGIADSTLKVMTIPRTIDLMKQIQADLGQYQQKLTGLADMEKNKRSAQQNMEQAAREALKQFDELEQRLTEAALQQIRQSGDENGIRALESATHASGMAKDVLTARRHEKDFVMRGDDQYAGKLNALFDALDSRANELAGRIIEPSAREDLDAARKQIERYRSEFANLRQSIQLHADSEIELNTRASGISDSSTDALNMQMQLLEADAHQAKTILATAAAIGFVVGLLSALLIAQLIVVPLRQAVSQARKVAAGDLTSDIRSDRKDELGQLMQAMQDMTESLRSLLKRLSSGIEQLATAAEEMSAVTEQTSAGVTQQKMETEQVATAMHQMVTTVQDVARNAESAADSAGHADRQAQHGTLVVQQAIERIENLAHAIEQSAGAIERLKHDSTNIGTVLDVIKSIAEQTNLLALNAAIEAARAGDAGRGFAVVADEVRALARRTQESTTQIEQLVSTLQDGAQGAVDMMGRSRTQAGQTVEAAKEAGNALLAINTSVSNIQQLNQQIATAAEQQSAVAEEINRSVTSIRDVAEQSAAATEETSVASVDLARLGTELQTEVGRFRLA
ncbi:HAMP domain-containing methyl-accepting chemotaxis protein [Metapseudomonas resinovorans]|uniref:HAMP domain-containing methyl-accepting chemotaxis protein n=1 Tax=Metapseudomonas resinovorans TaxID=53412 RepID=UPI00041DC388|nr:methyl-accepting chemotaxis protein [Pseudomonas resinovorans]MDE3736527.1 methyl-accepting chemotaxis protein [Pseudomonas resinovorans]